jgi:hypothetical protein
MGTCEVNGSDAWSEQPKRRKVELIDEKGLIARGDVLATIKNFPPQMQTERDIQWLLLVGARMVQFLLPGQLSL